MAIKPLPDVPSGSRIFVDTNILIYHLLDDELYGAACRDFLKRVETGALTAFTSPVIVSETLFIYLRAWVIQSKNVAPKRVLRYLKRHRSVVDEVDFHKPLALIGLMRLLPITNEVMAISYDLMTRLKLLPADSIHAALIQRYRISALASRDDDFDHLVGLDVYKP